MFSRNGAILAAAVVLGLIAVLVANAWFSGVEQRQERQAQEQMLARIVVASQPLDFGSRLTPDNVRLQNWPANSVPQGAFRSVADALKDNRVALRPIVPGEPVLADRVSGTDGRATLAANLPEGMRAVSIPISTVSGVSGFVLPGTTVDVLLTRRVPGDAQAGQDQMVDVIMENVQVLAIDQVVDTKSGKPKPGKTAVLQTDLYGAQKLVLAEKLGSLSLALRNVTSQEPAPFARVTARDLASGRGPGRGFVMPTGYRSAAPRYAAQTARPALVAASYGGAAAPAAPAGPVMSVYRGTEKVDYAVGRMAGR